MARKRKDWRVELAKAEDALDEAWSVLKSARLKLTTAMVGKHKEAQAHFTKVEANFFRALQKHERAVDEVIYQIDRELDELNAE